MFQKSIYIIFFLVLHSASLKADIQAMMDKTPQIEQH